MQQVHFFKRHIFYLPSYQAAPWWHVCSVWLDRVHSAADISPVFCTEKYIVSFSAKDTADFTKHFPSWISFLSNQTSCKSLIFLLLPSNITEAVESGLCIFAGSRGVEASFARLVEERSVVVTVIWVVQLHVNHTACWTVTFAVLLLLKMIEQRRGQCL